MKLWALSAIAALSFNAHAGKLLKLYKSDTAPAELRYVGVFKPTIGSGSYFDNYLVAFGEGLRYQVYQLDGLASYDRFAGKVKSVSETTILSTTTVERDKTAAIKFTRAGDDKLIFEGNYTVYQSASSTTFANNVDKAVEAEFAKYRTMDAPATTKELRRIFTQIEMDSGYDHRDSNEFPFPTFDLQIEYQLHSTPANATLAAATVSRSGSDAISKMFLKNSAKWFDKISDAEYDLTEKIESNVDIEEMVFASYSNRVSYEGLSPRLQKAISKHLKTEVLEVDGWDCEDSTYTWTSATWILKDGSTVSYSPGTECD